MLTLLCRRAFGVVSISHRRELQLPGRIVERVEQSVRVVEGNLLRLAYAHSQCSDVDGEFCVPQVLDEDVYRLCGSSSPSLTEQGPRCIQLGKGTASGSEDCLQLNVFTPPNATTSSNLPVGIWIHGGGYQDGELCTIATPPTGTSNTTHPRPLCGRCRALPYMNYTSNNHPLSLVLQALPSNLIPPRSWVGMTCQFVPPPPARPPHSFTLSAHSACKPLLASSACLCWLAAMISPERLLV